MNWFDGMISYFAPGAGLKRARARLAQKALRMRYEGAQSREGWRPVGSSATAELQRDLRALRFSSRDVVRNVPYGSRAMDVLAGLYVGSGIRPAALVQDETAKRVMAVWKEWAETTACDASGQTNFYGLQSLCVREMFEAGEVLIRRRFRRPADNLPVPLQLQVLEADHFDDSKNGPSGAFTDIMGVRFNGIGQIVGYHLFDYHPGDNVFATQRHSRLVPAEQIIHLFERKRPSAVRGVPRFHSVLRLIQSQADLQQARLDQNIVQATIAVFLESAEEDDGQIGAATGLGEPGEGAASRPAKPPLRYIQSGMVHELPKGKKATSLQPSGSSSANDFKRQLDQEEAVGLGLTYDQLSGDLSQANFSSLRAGRLVQNRIVQQGIHNTIIPLLCHGVWDWFSGAGQLSGRFEKAPAVRWMPQGQEPVDRKKDRDADALELGDGSSTWGQTVQGRGLDPETQFEELREEVAKWDAAGLLHPVKKAAPKGTTPQQRPKEDEDEDDDDKEN